MIKRNAIHEIRGALPATAVLLRALVHRNLHFHGLAVTLIAAIAAGDAKGNTLTHSAVFGEVALFDISSPASLSGGPLPASDSLAIPGTTGSMPYFNAVLGRLTAVVYTVSAEFFDFSGLSTIDIYPASLDGAGASIAVDAVLNVQVLGGQKLHSGLFDHASCELSFADSCRLPFSGGVSGELVFEEGELPLDSYIGVGHFDVDVHLELKLGQSLFGSSRYINHGADLKAFALGFVEITYYYDPPSSQSRNFSEQNRPK